MTFVARERPKEEVEAIHAELEKLAAAWKKSMQAFEPRPNPVSTDMSTPSTAHMTPLAPAVPASGAAGVGVGNCPPMMAVFVPFRAADPSGMQFMGMPPGMQAMPIPTTNVMIHATPASSTSPTAEAVARPTTASRKRSRPGDMIKQQQEEEEFDLDMFKEFPEFAEEPPKRSCPSSPVGTTATVVGGDEPEALEISDSGSDVNEDQSIEHSLLALFPDDPNEENCHFDEDSLPLDDAYWLEVE